VIRYDLVAGTVFSLDDVAVGAPLFTNSSKEGFDIGRVYVYYQTNSVSTDYGTLSSSKCFNFRMSPPRSVVLNLFHCWDPLNAIDVVWDPQVKIEKVCAPE